MKKNKKAFTLAEVLIALTIIGVIAAITVPALVQRTNKQEIATALQKTYSTLSQATNQIIAEHGSPKGEDGWLQNLDNAYDMYKKYLISAKECSSETGCYYQKTITGLNGRKFNLDESDGYRKLILADGIQIALVNLNKNCTDNRDGSTNFCLTFTADINGAKKPNKAGRDNFNFVLKETGLVPAGCDDKTFICHNFSGYGCTCKVLQEGAINY